MEYSVLFWCTAFYIVIMMVVLLFVKTAKGNKFNYGDLFVCVFWFLCFVLWAARLLLITIFCGGKEFFKRYLEGFK